MIVVLVALAATGAGVWISVSRQTEATAAAVSDTLFALSLPDLENKPQSFNQWRGKVLLVNFWATWCAPCREEIPIFVKLQEKYRTQGLQIIGISIDQVGKTSEFTRNFRINYPSLIGTFDTIDDTGLLVLRHLDGTTRTVTAGDVFALSADRRGSA